MSSTEREHNIHGNDFKLEARSSVTLVIDDTRLISLDQVKGKRKLMAPNLVP